MLNLLHFNYKQNNVAFKSNGISPISSSRILKQSIVDELVINQPLDLQKCKKALSRMNLLYPKTTSLQNPRPIIISKKLGTKFVDEEAFLADTSYKDINNKTLDGFAIFSKDSKLLGFLQYVDAEECKAYRKVDFWSGKPTQYGVENYLRLHHLWTIPKNYKGIGSALIDEAKNKSIKLGLDGQLKVLAQNSFDKKKGSPAPFYAKKGFILADWPKMRKTSIVKTFSTPEYTDAPVVMFLLSPAEKKKLINRKT